MLEFVNGNFDFKLPWTSSISYVIPSYSTVSIFSAKIHRNNYSICLMKNIWWILLLRARQIYKNFFYWGWYQNLPWVVPDGWGTCCLNALLTRLPIVCNSASSTSSKSSFAGAKWSTIQTNGKYFQRHFLDEEIYIFRLNSF